MNPNDPNVSLLERAAEQLSDEADRTGAEDRSGAASARVCPPRSTTLTPRLTLDLFPCGRREPLPL